MDIDPEEYKRLLKETFAEWREEANTAPLPICFPEEVLEKLETVFGTYPSWDLIFAALERVISDTELEKTFAADLEHLCEDEDSFPWPLDDPHYRLLLGDLSKPFPLVTPELEATLRELAPKTRRCLEGNAAFAISQYGKCLQ
jgi:hypothetical protein